jgi:hypothetical protein
MYLYKQFTVAMLQKWNKIVLTGFIHNLKFCSIFQTRSYLKYIGHYLLYYLFWILL